MAGTSSRGNPSFADIVRSVLVLGLALLAIYGAGQIFTVNPQRPVQGKDLGQSVTAARGTVVEFTPVAPRALPQGWMVSSAQPSQKAWSLNVLTDDEQYIGLQQSLESEQDLIDERKATFRREGTAGIAGRQWAIWEPKSGRDIAFTRRDDGVSTLVIGTASTKTIESYIASLEPVDTSK